MICLFILYAVFPLAKFSAITLTTATCESREPRVAVVGLWSPSLVLLPTNDANVNDPLCTIVLNKVLIVTR